MIAVAIANEFLTTDFKQKAFVVQIPKGLEDFSYSAFSPLSLPNQIFLLVIQ